MSEKEKQKEALPDQNTNSEALRLYNIVKEITSRGCDVEVKNIKGELKIIKVKRQSL